MSPCKSDEACYFDFNVKHAELSQERIIKGCTYEFWISCRLLLVLYILLLQ